MDKITNIVDAIRIGSLKHAQCFGITRMRDMTCAIGAAIEATVGIDNIHVGPREYIRTRFAVPDSVVAFVIRCNDERRLSRETIAAILAAREWKAYDHKEGLL